MTPEQQIREALDLGLQVWRTTKSSQRFHEAFAALDRLVAERDEARAALREGAERGESEAIRAWCSLTLAALGGGS